MAFKMKGSPMQRNFPGAFKKETKILGRERTVEKDPRYGNKTVTIKKKAKDGEVEYRSKIKRKVDGKLVSKVKGKGAYSTKTGATLRDTEKIKRGRRGEYSTDD